MANDNETVEQVCAGIKTRIEELWEQSLGEMLNGEVDEFSDRILAAHKREMADEKRISDAVVQSLRDKKLEMAGEIVEKDAEISDLRAFVKEIADVLNNTKNYMCFHCTVRNCPGEYDCRDTKKYCLLIAKAREVIGGAE